MRECTHALDDLLAQLREKVLSGQKLNTEERLALFDANMNWLDELQAERLKEAKVKGTRLTRGNRGWTREELYEDRGPKA
jgi:hypothetical protein